GPKDEEALKDEQIKKLKQKVGELVFDLDILREAAKGRLTDPVVKGWFVHQRTYKQEEAPRAVTDVVVGDDGLPRCLWGYSTPEYHDYHDHEWGWQVGDDRRILEKICLEGFQAGLSWLTILRKREGFRRAFVNFDPAVIAAFGPTEIEQLIRDPHIVRNRAKIEATIANA